MDITPHKDAVAPKPTVSSGFMHMFDGIHFKFPTYKHDHPPVINVNEAAFATPLIMMSQNRQSEKDRLTAQNDYQTDCKGEEEVRFLMEHLDHQDTVLLQLVKRVEEQHAEIKEHLARLDPTLAQKLGIDVIELSKESLEGDEITGNS